MPQEHTAFEPDADYCERVAASFGNPNTAEQVYEVITASNDGGHIVHGIAQDTEVHAGVKRRHPDESVSLRSPSHWVSGKYIFNSDPDDEAGTMYTPFFDEGHSFLGHESQRAGKVTIMTLALTNRKVLKDVLGFDLHFKPDYDYELDLGIPFQAAQILRVEISHDELCDPDPEAEMMYGRAKAQIAEQHMLDLVHNAVMKGYKTGHQTLLRANY
ncbi:MAG TPA: hypothetical protein VI913_00650 [Candidatus Peribacteraceae bacterium]|nr:hypothetical protein [Candidatus Peribacteraceae bacterium]